MIRNYTSSVPVAQSLSFIEQKLSDFGASMILKEYDAETKRLSGLCFMVPIGGVQVPFKLPARAEECARVLRKEIRRPRPGTEQRINEQADRTAWKLMAEWVDMQLTLVRLDQVKFVEAFLAFAYDPATKQTFFQRVEKNNFKLLTGGAS